MPAPVVPWNHPELNVITDLLLQPEAGSNTLAVVSCSGKMDDGTKVRVELPFTTLHRYRVHKTIIRHAIAAHPTVYVKKLKIMEAIRFLPIEVEP